MFRTINDQVWSFDCEWVPDPLSARLLYGDFQNDEKAIERLWKEAGATEENPTPFIKMIQCRIVSIAVLIRRKRGNDTAQLMLMHLPKVPADKTSRHEKSIISAFLNGIARAKPQLVGFNSKAADIRILANRAITLGVRVPEFMHRPDKPWNGIDYFARDNEAHIDLFDVLGSKFSLSDISSLSGIPGKFEAHGDQVWKMWREGRFEEIVQYNCFDAISTYLVWLRTAWVSGHFTDEQYVAEEEALREYLMMESEKPGHEFLERYIAEWDRLKALHEKYDNPEY